MSILDRFRSKDTDEVSNEEVNEEVDADYQPEPNTGKLAAVLFGFFALVITIALVSGLFFGGRAVYRAFMGPNDEQNVAEQKEQNETATQQNAENKSESSTSAGSGEESDSSNYSSNSSRSARRTPPAGDNIPATGDQMQSLPATGDEGL